MEVKPRRLLTTDHASLVRPKHFEEDMTWLRIGNAVRTAIDINLHRIALLKEARDGLPSWLIRTMVRTWLMSFISDRTLSAQLGKPSSMRGDGSVPSYIKVLMEPTSPDASGEDSSGDDFSIAAWAVSGWRMIEAPSEM